MSSEYNLIRKKSVLVLSIKLICFC